MAISDEIFPRVSNEVKAKGAWDVLEKEYKGSTKVRSVKLQHLRRDFEYARMKDDELLNDYLTRLTDVINQMKSYGENIVDSRIVEKLLLSLSPKYDTIVSVIEQIKDLESLTIEELKGSIKAFDQRLEIHAEHSVETSFQSLNVSSKGKWKAESSTQQSKPKVEKNWKSTNQKNKGKSTFEKKFVPEVATPQTHFQKCKICAKCIGGSVGIRASLNVPTVIDLGMFKRTAITKPITLKKYKVKPTFSLLVMQQLYMKMIEFGMLTVGVAII